MKYYLIYSTGPHDPQITKVCQTLREALEKINFYASNEEFKFLLIEGKALNVKPVKTIIKYEVVKD